ncbi:hypothetical protein DPMN_010537 [Dreissena polymorpha]|uniref:Uncharacterized protein n=1 Tax=Dreissena polymorpha TaxID=45954 RepID=A0A9D4N2G4_DREPO|nr:hypothetical protein DPMN_010537 [Dreissena polymorpha]
MLRVLSKQTLQSCYTFLSSGDINLSNMSRLSWLNSHCLAVKNSRLLTALRSFSWRRTNLYKARVNG